MSRALLSTASSANATTLRALAAYYARSLTDPGLAAVFLTGDRSLEELVALILRQAESLRLLHPAVDVPSTADLLVAGVTGLALDVVHGTRSSGEVCEIIDRQLDQLFRDATGFPASEATRR